MPSKKRTSDSLDLSRYYPSVTSKANKDRVKELRKEYSKLRAIAQKRIKRLETSEFGAEFKASPYKHGFKKLKGLQGDEFSRELYRLAKFVYSPLSTISGRRRTRSRSLLTLRAHGYTNINENNFHAFVEFMEMAKSRLWGNRYDSERVAAWYDEVYAMEDDEEKGGDIWKEFEEWYEEETAERRRISELLSKLGFEL